MERLDEEEYRTALPMLWTAAQAISTLPLDKMLDAINHAESIGSLLDPTAYIRNADKMHQDKMIIEAAIPLCEAIRSMREL